MLAAPSHATSDGHRFRHFLRTSGGGKTAGRHRVEDTSFLTEPSYHQSRRGQGPIARAEKFNHSALEPSELARGKCSRALTGI